MLLFFIIPIVLAGVRKYSPKYAFTSWELYPLYAVELVHIFFQVNAYFGNYQFVQYSSYIQTAMNISLLLPIISKKLYVTALVGSGSVLAGSALNAIVINANDGHMPVYATLSELTGFFHETALGSTVDELHIIMSDATRLNFLGDYIDLGFCIMSPGDILIHFFVSAVIYCTVKSAAINAKKVITEGKQNG